jgi:hypothetical protein
MPDETKSSGETITELAHRHLKDQTHTTTDEELRNVKLELDRPFSELVENSSHSDNSIPPPKKEEKSEDEEETELFKEQGHPPNPYDVLG